VIPIPGVELNDLDTGLQKSVQSSAGVELRLGNEWTSTLTLFQNAFFELTDLLSLSRFSDQLEQDITLDTRSLGHSYGLEFVLRRPLTRRFAGYFAYTLSRSERSIGRIHDVASFDRTHVLHLAGAYDLGNRWRLGTRLTFYSGLPARIADESSFEASPPVGPNGEAPVTPARPLRRPSFTAPRAPAFFRVDLRIEKRWLIGTKGAWFSFVFEVLNSTLSREVVAYTCYENGCEGEPVGPVTIPSIGVEAAF
jgi:hypothetical protein